MARNIPDAAEMPLAIGTWLAELAEIGRKNDAGQSAKEMAAQAGMSVKRLLVLLNEAKTAGRLETGWRTQSRLDGIPYQVAVYRVLPAPKKAKR